MCGGTWLSPSIQEAESGRSLWIQGQPGLHNEFHNSQRCINRKTLSQGEKNKKTKTKTTVILLLKQQPHNLLWVPLITDGKLFLSGTNSGQMPFLPGMVVHAFDPSTREAEAGLVYKVSFRTARATQRNPVSKNQKKKKAILRSYRHMVTGAHGKTQACVVLQLTFNFSGKSRWALEAKRSRDSFTPESLFCFQTDVSSCPVTSVKCLWSCVSS